MQSITKLCPCLLLDVSFQVKINLSVCCCRRRSFWCRLQNGISHRPQDGELYTVPVRRDECLCAVTKGVVESSRPYTTDSLLRAMVQRDWWVGCREPCRWRR